jgi:hypothetical protein
MEELNITEPQADVQAEVQVEQTPTEDNVTSYFNDVIKPSGDFTTESEFREFLSDKGQAESYFKEVVGPAGDFGSFEEFSSFLNVGGVGKPMPSVQTNIGGAEQKSTTLKPATQSPLKSSGIQSISERLIKTPSSYYTQKITEDITLPQARYVVSSMGYSMNDISNEELTDVLANKESYRSLGHMVDDVKGRIAQNRQTQAEEPVQPEGGRVTKTTKTVLGKEVKKEPMVMAPEDPFGFDSVIKEVESPERPKAAVLQSYDNDQQATIDAEKNMRDWQKISESPINPQSGELKPESVRKQERAVFEGYQRDFQRLSQRSTKSLEQAKPVIDQYADALTDGVKWQSFQNKEGNFDAYKINDAAKRIAKESGFSDDGPAVKYIEDQIKAKSQFKKIQPEIEARYAEKQQEILGALEADQTKVAEEFKGVSKTLAETNLQIEGLATEVSALIATEADPIRKDYELSTSDIKTGYDALDKDLQNQINQNAQLYKSGQITFEQATQNEQQLIAQREELSNQTNIELGNQFDLLTSRLNEVNSKYKQRYERQKNEIASAAEAKFQKEFQQFAKDKNLTEDAMIKLKAAYKDAYDATILADKEKRQAFEKEIGEGLFRIPEFGKFARSIFGQDGEYFQTSYLLPINTKVAGIAFENSLGTALEAIGNEMGFEAMRIAGKQMALSSDLLAPKEDISWGDLADWISFQKSAGNLAGSMAPSLLATAVATTATGGLGLGAVGAATIGALAGWQTESMQMASQVYLDTLKETGDAVLAQRRADNMWDFQKSIIFSYGLEALPFMGILKKGTSQMVQRVALGAAAELGTETVIQEFPQTVAEEAIMKDQNAMKAVGNAYKGVAGYLASKVGGDAPTEQEVKDYQLFKRVVIETAPVAVLGGGGQAISSLREQRVMDAAEKVGKAYMQKAVFGSVSPIQTNQFLSDLVSVKGVDFATTMVTGLFTSGQITEVEKNKMLDGISKSETIIDTAKRQKMNKAEASVFSFLNFLNDDMAGQIEQESDPNVKSALESKQKAIETDLKNFLITKKSDLFIVEYADGSQTLMAPDDITTLSQNEAFINELRDGNLSIKGLSAEFTSKQKPIVDDINARMEASKQAAPEAAAEKPMKTLEDELSIGDTVDLTPSIKPTETTTTTAPAEKPTIELPKVKDEVNNTPVTDRDENNQDVTRYIPFSIVEAANKNDKRSGQTAKQIADRGGYSVKELDVFLPNWRDMLPTATAQPTESTAATESMVGQQTPTQTQGQPEILLSGLREGWVGVSYYSFDPREFRDLMTLINGQRSFAKVVEKKGKKYVVVGLSLAPESRRDARTSGRDNFSFAAVELNENTPSNIVETLENSARENFKNIYRDFSSNDSVSPVKEVDSELAALQTKTKPTEAVPAVEETTTAPIATNARSKYEEEIKLADLSDKVVVAQRNIANADNVELAIEEYNKAKKERDDFESSIKNRKQQEKSAKNIESLIEDQRVASEEVGYEYKELYDKDPRLAAIQSIKDMIEFIESGDLEKFYVKEGVSPDEAQKITKRSLERNKKDLADLEADIKAKPTTQQAAEEEPSIAGGKRTRKAQSPKNKKQREDAARRGDFVYHTVVDDVYESTPDEYNAALKEISETGAISNAAIGKKIPKSQVPSQSIVEYAPNLMRLSKEDAQYELEQRAKPTKTTTNAVQEQAAGQVPVQSEAGVSETMAQGEPQAEPQVTPTEGQAKAEEVNLSNKSIDELEKRQAEIEGSKNEKDRIEFNEIDKELEKREWQSVLNSPIEEVVGVVDSLIEKEKKKPNGFGAYIDLRDAKETKAVATKYSGEVSKNDAKKDFKDSFFGNPSRSYADGLKMRESVRAFIEQGGTFKELLQSVQGEFESDGFSEQEAATIIKNKLDEVSRKNIAEQAQAPAEEKREVRPTDQEMKAGNTELNSVKVGETITTTQPSRIYKGTFGKRNPDGSIRSAHPDVKGSFGSTNMNIALKYKGNESFKAFDIPAGTTIEVVKTPKFSEGISIARQDETDRINNSTAQIVRLDTIDNGGKQSQFIIKDRSLIDNGYLVEEQATETTQAKEEDLLTADTKDKTNLQKVFDFLDKLDSDLDKFGRETTGMNLPIPVIKAIIKTAKALVATGITLQEAIRRAAAENNVSEQDAIDAIRSYTEQANVPPQAPPIIPPPIGTEEREGSTQRVSSIYERMALKAESEGKIDLAAKLRDSGLYTQRSIEFVKEEGQLLIDTFGGDIEAAADFVMNNPVKGDVRTYVLGERAKKYKERAIANPTAENIAAAGQAWNEFAVYSTDLGQATNFIKEVEANNPDLFYIGRFSEYIATLADNLGNPAVTTTNANKVDKAAKEVVKLRKDILNQVANVISGMADNATIDNLMIDALKLDKAGKDRVLTNRMRSGLRKIAGSVESKKIIGEKLKKLADLGIFGLAETREEVKELIRRGLAEVNPSLQTPLDTAEIKEMAEMFMIIYEEMATQKMDALLDKAFNGNNKNNAAVIKAVMYGALDTPNALNKFAQKFGLSYITPQMQQQLRNAAQNVANARGNAARSVAQAAFTSMFNNFIYQSKPTGYKILSSLRSFFKYFSNIFYNTALFAINTFDRASQGNILRTFGNILNAVARGDFKIIADSFKDVYRKKDVSFNYTDRNGNVQSIDAKTRLVFDDVYSSLRGLPRLAEVKRAGGLNEVEIDIRNTDSRLKRRLLRTFAVPASRIMGAVDATVMPLNMFLTKRQAFYDVLKAFYKDKGIAISEAQLRTQLNDILGVDTDYISKAMEQAVVDVMGSKLWTDLGFTNTDEFPVSDPRLKTGKGSRESKIYNEFLFRTREILDSEENKRLQDSFSKMGYGGLMTPTESDLMSAAIDNYAIKVSGELAFLGTPRGSMRLPAETISKLSTKYPLLKYVGLAPLFTNAAFNSVSMAIRIAPGFNILQYLKYWYTGTRGGQKGSQKEFGADYEQLTKIDQNKMLKTVLLTNALFLVATALKPYDDKEEEKKAIDDKTWTGSTPLKITKAQTDLGYLPGRIYIKGEGYDYRDNPLALLISGISFVRNYGLWSFDNKSNNFYVEDDAEIGYDPTFIEQASAYAQYIITSMLEFSTIKDMSKTYSDIIEILSPPKGEDDIKQYELASRFVEKKGANIIRTSIPYTRFVAEMKTITDAIMDEEKKLPITFYDNIVFGHAIEDNVIKTNGYDFFGRPVKDAFTLILPFVSSVSINQDPKVDREHTLYRKMNYTPRLLLNDRLSVHITLDDLNGDANKFEDFFKRVKAEEKKGDGLVGDVERKSKSEQRVLVSLFMSKEEANLVNQKACEFAGKFVEKNFADLQSMDRARFKDAMNSIYNIGREVAIYQNLGNLIEYDKADYYSMINNKIKKFKDTYVGSTMDNLTWPQEFEPSDILGDSFETQPKVIL